MMEIQTQRFVVLSDLFKDCSALAELFHEDDHPNITWGGAVRTMVSSHTILLWAEKTQGEAELWNEEYDPNTINHEVETLRSRVWALADVLVDLEN